MITSELVHAGGRTLVVKRADPEMADDVARLTREATMLAMARHPGVVEPADPPDPAPTDPTGVPAPLELRTLFAGARTLAAADLDPLAAVRALAAAAETVADLHALGLVHGRIEPDHIVLTPSGRAVLCGFAEAGLAGDLRSDGVALVPSLDVAGLGSALERVLADAPGRPQPRRAGLDRTAAGRLVERATATDPALRPSARTFAAALAAALPQPAAPSERSRRLEPVAPAVGDLPSPRPGLDPPDPDATASPDLPRTGDPRRPHRRRRLFAAAGAVTAVVWLGIGIGALTRAPRPSTPPSPPTAAAATGHSDPEVLEPNHQGEPDHRGERARPGGELDLDGHHLALGTSDDQVVRAVWSCAGAEAVVLVRPDGSVFRFDGLATTGHDVIGVLVGRVPEGAAVELVTGADGCTALQAHTPDRTVTLSIPSSTTSPTPA